MTCSVYNVHSVSTDLSICLEGLSSVFDVQAYSLTPLSKEFQQCVLYQCNWLKSVNAQCKYFHAIYIRQIILNTLQFFYKNTIIPLVFVLLFFFPLLWWLSSQWINSKGKITWEDLCSLPTAVWSVLFHSLPWTWMGWEVNLPFFPMQNRKVRLVDLYLLFQLKYLGILAEHTSLHIWHYSELH